MDNANSPVIPLDPKHAFNDYGYRGLTKREHFAVEFMKAEIIGVYSITEPGEYHHWNHDDFTRAALGHADALLSALEAKQ